MKRKARTVPFEKKLLPAFRRDVKIGQFGGRKFPVVNKPSKDMGVETIGVHGERFDEVAAAEEARQADPQNVSIDVSGIIRSKDPFQREVVMPAQKALSALETKRLAEKAMKRGPEQHLVDEARAEASKETDEMIAASVEAQRKGKSGIGKFGG